VIGLTLNATAKGDIKTAIAVLTSTLATSFADADANTAIDVGVGLSSASVLISKGHSAIEHLKTDASLFNGIGTVTQLQLLSYPESQNLITNQSLQVAMATGYLIQQTITECYA
jgi:hypothetical protein